MHRTVAVLATNPSGFQDPEDVEGTVLATKKCVDLPSDDVPLLSEVPSFVAHVVSCRELGRKPWIFLPLERRGCENPRRMSSLVKESRALESTTICDVVTSGLVEVATLCEQSESVCRCTLAKATNLPLQFA